VAHAEGEDVLIAGSYWLPASSAQKPAAAVQGLLLRSAQLCAISDSNSL